MLIDFQISARYAEAAANAIGEIAQELGYHVKTYQSPRDRRELDLRMLDANARHIRRCHCRSTRLAEISVELGGYPDGWGTFGNKPGGQLAAE